MNNLEELNKLKLAEQRTSEFILKQQTASKTLQLSCERAIKKISQSLKSKAKDQVQQHIRQQITEPSVLWIKSFLWQPLLGNYAIGCIVLITISVLAWFSAKYATVAFCFLYLPICFFALRKGAINSSANLAEILTLFSNKTIGLTYFSQQPTNQKIRPYRVTFFPTINGQSYFANWPDIGEQCNLQFYDTCFICFFDKNNNRISHLLPLNSTNSLIALHDAQLHLNSFPSIAQINTNEPSFQLQNQLCQSLNKQTKNYSRLIKNLSINIETIENMEKNKLDLQQKINQLTKLDRIWNNSGVSQNIITQLTNLADLFLTGNNPPKGVLLYGPPGTGKTHIIKKLAEYCRCNFRITTLSDLKGQQKGQTAPKVDAIWDACRRLSPSIMFIDECESIFARRGSEESDNFGAELVQTFLAQWDGFQRSNARVLVIGATNRRDILDDAILSRFTAVIEITLPDQTSRQQIIQNQIQLNQLNLSIDKTTVDATNGLSARDISTLITNLKSKFNQQTPSDKDVMNELRTLRGKSSSTTASELTWDDIILQNDVKQEFQNLTKDFLQAEQLLQLGVPIPCGILLYGPPGTGKTQLARVLANQAGMAFFAITTADLKGARTGQSVQKVKILFERARTQAPCILFIDEIDIIAPTRIGDSVDNFTNEIIGQLLTELDGVSSKPGQIFLLAASNLPSNIDNAILSRFNRQIEIPLPNYSTRLKLLQLALKNKPVNTECINYLPTIAKVCDGLSGRDLYALTTQSLRNAVNRVRSSNADISSIQLCIDDIKLAIHQQDTKLN